MTTQSIVESPKPVSTDMGLDDASFLAAIDDIVMDDEIIESDDEISDALSDLAIKEELQAVYEEQDADAPVVVKAVAVEGDTEAEPELEPIETEAEPELEPIEIEIEVEPVVAKIKTVKGASRSAKIVTRLAKEFDDYAMLTPDWGTLSEEARADKFATVIDGMAKYVGDKAVNLFAFLKTGGALSVVTARAFEVLLKDGHVTGGKDGNMVQNLLAKPYSIGTANSQSNQILQLFTQLEIGKRTARGTVIVNEDSVILERVKIALKS